MASILLVNGPNLNLLGEREPEIYGNQTLDDTIHQLKEFATSKGHSLVSFQSNHEGELIDFIQREGERASGAIINLGGLTHTSIALRDAILARKLKFVEVHLSNLSQRESFRHHSYLSDIALGVIMGLGTRGYQYALDWLIREREARD